MISGSSRSSPRQWIVSKAEAGMTLLHFLASHLAPSYSSKALKRMVESQQCRLNQRIERFANSKLVEGDTVSLTILEPIQSSSAYKIVYEDHYIFVIDKPVGMVCEQTLLPKSIPYLLIHRLDKETTGLLLFAKSEEVKQAFIQLFRDKKVSKKYLALVHGVPKTNEGIISHSLLPKKTAKGQLYQTISDKGDPAETRWRLIAKANHAALIECSPITGRTHQLRVHLKSLGTPIIGDKLYGNAYTSSIESQSHMLHASSLTFIHPITHKQITLHTLPPEHFTKMQKRLGL